MSILSVREEPILKLKVRLSMHRNIQVYRFEMLDGRVKTLHPKIHAGILPDRQNKKHKNEMSKKNFPTIDLIVVNFYPFQKLLKHKN